MKPQQKNLVDDFCKSSGVRKLCNGCTSDAIDDGIESPTVLVEANVVCERSRLTLFERFSVRNTLPKKKKKKKEKAGPYLKMATVTQCGRIHVDGILVMRKHALNSGDERWPLSDWHNAYGGTQESFKEFNDVAHCLRIGDIATQGRREGC